MENDTLNVEVREYSSLDQLLWTEADEVDFVLYYSTEWPGYDAIAYVGNEIVDSTSVLDSGPVSDTMIWNK